ncbi:MAG: AbrB/MazE/SpoVT family DNA-binding domain-containing protein [Acetobacteraceae bacterium]|nr:AbrB/MazE/SpoVT family DNA-binding domain-containing protein [Acetobacteraceae bacterium]
MPLVKIKEKGQLTLPARIRERHGLAIGDYVDVTEEGSRIVLVPQTFVERRPAVDAAIAEGLADIGAGRISPRFDNAEDFEAWLETDEGKLFARAK